MITDIVYDPNLEPAIISLQRLYKENYLSIKGDFSPEAVYDVLPPGWKFATEFIFHLTNRLSPCILTSVRIEFGLLRVKATCDDPFDNSIFFQAAKLISRKAIHVCIVCQGPSFRRRTEPENPELCNKHFFQYCNYIADQQDSQQLLQVSI